MSTFSHTLSTSLFNIIETSDAIQYSPVPAELSKYFGGINRVVVLQINSYYILASNTTRK